MRVGSDLGCRNWERAGWADVICYWALGRNVERIRFDNLKMGVTPFGGGRKERMNLVILVAEQSWSGLTLELGPVRFADLKGSLVDWRGCRRSLDRDFDAAC